MVMGNWSLASSSGYVFVDYGNGNGTFRSSGCFSANYEFYPAVADPQRRRPNR